MAVSRTVVYGGVLALCLALYVWSQDEPSTTLKPTTKKANASKSKDTDWVFPVSETSAHFDKPKGSLRNIFKPLVEVDKLAIAKNLQEQQQLKSVPSKLAAGEANWIYTGMVEVDGSKLALLENSGTHQGGFVKVGDTWKKSKLVSVSSESIIVAGLDDGMTATVYRFNPNEPPKPKLPPEGGFKPFDISKELKGPIGPSIDISRIERVSPARRNAN